MTFRVAACNSAIVFLLGACVVNAARLLHQDPDTYVSVTGQAQEGQYAIGSHAEAYASSGSESIPYNAGRIVVAGDIYPGPVASSTSSGGNWARSGNAAGEVSMNAGTAVVATTSTGARAVAGSGMFHTAGVDATVASNSGIWRPHHADNRGSLAYTDNNPDSAAVTGTGDGVVAYASAGEVSAMARSERNTKFNMVHVTMRI